MRAKTRDFHTTGVIFRIGEQWFTKKGVKEKTAEVLRSLLLREYSISPSDIDVVASNISVIRGNQKEALADAIVIYDSTNGSLRLSEPAYVKLKLLLDRLRTAVESTANEADLLPPDVVSDLCGWEERPSPEYVEELAEMLRTERIGDRQGWLQVYAPGSRLAKRDVQGILTEIEIIAPEIVSIDGPPKLFYRYRVNNSLVRAMTAADAIEAVGDEWQFVYWNPESDEYQESFDDLVVRDTDRPVSISDSIIEPEV
jgi:hypothetical protein